MWGWMIIKMGLRITTLGKSTSCWEVASCPQCSPVEVFYTEKQRKRPGLYNHTDPVSHSSSPTSSLWDLGEVSLSLCLHFIPHLQNGPPHWVLVGVMVRNKWPGVEQLIPCLACNRHSAQVKLPFLSARASYLTSLCLPFFFCIMRLTVCPSQSSWAA